MQTKIIPTDSTAATLRYVTGSKRYEAVPAGSRMAHISAQNCGVSTAVDNFSQLRREYRQDKRERKLPGRYYEPDDPTDATHLKQGKNWREARSGEEATHVRVAPENEFAMCNDGYHIIVSFGLHEVNPDDPQQTAEAFRFVEDSIQQIYPGQQGLLVGQTDAEGSPSARARGEGGKFHVHYVTNSVLAKDMELGGTRFRAGQRQKGDLTNIDDVRRRMDDRLNTHHQEYGLPAQVMAPVGSREYERGVASKKDYYDRVKGKLSDEDRVRLAVDDALGNIHEREGTQLGGMSSNDRLQVFGERLIEMTGNEVQTSIRTTKAGDQKLRSYRLDGRATPLGRKLGKPYMDQGVQEQLEEIAQGTWERQAAHQDLTHLPKREMSDLPVEELTEVRRGLRTSVAADMVEKMWRENPEMHAAYLRQVRESGEGSVASHEEVTRSAQEAYIQGELAEYIASGTALLEEQRQQDVNRARQEELEAQREQARQEELERAREQQAARDRRQALSEAEETLEKPSRITVTDRPAGPVQGVAQADEDADRPYPSLPLESGRIDGTLGHSTEDVDMLAVIAKSRRRSEETPSMYMVDYQLREGQPLAQYQTGLSLFQSTPRDGAPTTFKSTDRSALQKDLGGVMDEFVDSPYVLQSGLIRPNTKVRVVAFTADLETIDRRQVPMDIRRTDRPITADVMKRQEALLMESHALRNEGRLADFSPSFKVKQERMERARDGRGPSVQNDRSKEGGPSL